MKRVLLALALVAACALLSPAVAGNLRTVPPGNRNATQPKIPHGSTVRTEAEKTTFDEKYGKVRDLLANDKSLIGKIKTTAAAYDIDPIHMIGAIVGEHTYNVDAFDRLQTYYVQAISYATSRFRFGYGDETIAQFLARPEFEKCKEFSDDSYKLWTCRENVWDKTFSGKKVGEINFPRDRFNKVFFQPFYAGQTFGLGQETPLMALTMSDLVAKTSGLPKLDENKAADVYEAIMNPDKSLAYMAASIRHAIDDYKNVAKVDISKNPGITATLYNIGRSAERAAVLARNGGLPEENYFGWFINSKLADLKTLLDAQAPSAGTAKKTAQADR